MRDFGDVKMNAFDIGFVPSGWKRGEAIYFINPTSELVGQIRQKALPPLGETDAHSAACVVFTAADASRVNTWLDWWRSPASQTSEAR
jgi:hypothetical protein